MEMRPVVGPGDPDDSRDIAIKGLLDRLGRLELGAWPPSDWARYEIETALLQAESGNYNFACALLEMTDNPLRPMVEAGIIRFKRAATTAAQYRQRIEAIGWGRRSWDRLAHDYSP